MRRWFFISAVFFSLTALAQERAACIPFSGDEVFGPEEELTYGVSYKWGAVNTEVATAQLKVEDGGQYNGVPIYHSVVSARTAPFFDVFFKIREHFEGWFEKKTLAPQKCLRDTHEGTYAAYNLFYYDWQARQIHARVESTSEGNKTLDIPLVDCVCDIPSLVYFLRRMDVSKMEEGNKYGLNFAIDDTIFHIHLKNCGLETVKVKGMGKVRCHYLRCSVVTGAVFEGNEDVKIWLSDDANQVPVAFWAPLRVGAMRGFLKNYENLSYAFTAQEEK